MKTGRGQSGFTLIEIMIVVGIIGIVMAMGIPSIVSSFKKEGMRKAVSEIREACDSARAGAIMSGTTAELVFRSEDNSFRVVGGIAKDATGQLPEGVAIAELSIFGMSYLEASEARIHFHPNGTCDDAAIALLSDAGELQRITLELTTGLNDVEKIR